MSGLTGFIRRFDGIGAGDVAEAGGKGANLGELVRAGFPVPPGFVLSTAAYDAFVEANGLAATIVELATEPVGDTVASEEPAARIAALFRAGKVPDDIGEAVRGAYRELGGADVAVAVRSSATAEDLADASFAGQQDTFLNVRGGDAVLSAVVDCWASLWTPRAMVYRRQQGIEPGTVSLAVVVQQMVEADSSGVMFTADPGTGRRDRVVVSAAWGLGESVVSGSVSTDDHVVDKATGALVSRHTADKEVLTVPTATGTEERPVPGDRRGVAVLDDAAVTELARLGIRIEDHYGTPQDIEWARAGGRLWVVQSRPITALPDPAADPPTSWPVPYPHGLYFRASIVEQLPDPLTPLFADMIDGSVTRSLRRLFGQAFGLDALRPGEIGLPTINGYAYYFYGTAALRRMVTGTPRAARSLTGNSAAGIKELGGVVGWRERSHPQYVDAVRTWTTAERSDMPSAELLRGVGELLDAATVYYTAVQSIIPLAATSELTFRGFYDRFVRRDHDPAGHTFLLGFDSEPIRAEKSLHDLAVAAGRDPQLAAVVSGADPADLLGDVRHGLHPAGVDQGAWEAWSAQFRRHLERYGHTVYNLDFADPVPADEPGPLLDTIRFYLAGGGTDPHERQRRTAQQRDRQSAAVRARLDPARRAVFDRLLRWAQETGPVREDALADVGLAWPVMRRMLLELGRRLVTDGLLGDPADVFWLRHEELRRAAVGEEVGDGLAGAIAERRMLWRGQKLAVPPQMLPDTGILYRLSLPFLPAGDQFQTGSTISGVAASSGAVTAPARVLSGPGDFGAMCPGEVLVARITTPAWTSLFAMAAGVVTDVGGPLSHSSIVAREYGIPAVLGTGSATGRIRTGQLVRVDGDAGTVTLLDEESDDLSDGTAPVEAAPAAGRSRAPWLVVGAAVGAALVVRRRRRRSR